jgi:hypothetical protein
MISRYGLNTVSLFLMTLFGLAWVTAAETPRIVSAKEIQQTTKILYRVGCGLFPRIFIWRA